MTLCGHAALRAVQGSLGFGRNQGIAFGIFRCRYHIFADIFRNLVKPKSFPDGAAEDREVGPVGGAAAAAVVTGPLAVVGADVDMVVVDLVLVPALALVLLAAVAMVPLVMGVMMVIMFTLLLQFAADDRHPPCPAGSGDVEKGGRLIRRGRAGPEQNSPPGWERKIVRRENADSGRPRHQRKRDCRR